jgi:hypothetical protein
MASLIFRYWLKLVYLFEAVVLVAGMLLANKEVQQFALTAFAITVAAHLAVSVLGDFMRFKSARLNILKISGVLIFLGLAVAGALSIAGATGMAECFWNALVWMRTRFVGPPPV